MRLDRPAPYRVAANKRQARRSPGARKALEHRQRERDELRAIRADPSFGDRDPDRSRAFPAEATDPKAIRRELGTVLLQWAPAGELNRIVGCLTHGTADRPLAPPLQHKALATSRQATAHRISPVRHVSREEGHHPGHRGGPHHAT